MARQVKQARIHKDLSVIIDFVKAKYIMAGKQPPTSSQITKKIASKIKKEELVENVFIRF